MNSDNIMIIKRNQSHKKNNYCTIPFIWMPRIGKSIQKESRLVIASGWGETGRWGNETYYKMDWDDGCTTLWISKTHWIVVYFKWVEKLYLNKDVPPPLQKKETTHTHHNIQTDWVKAEHTFMAQYFLVDFILNSELTIWELHINDNFSVYSFLIFQVVQMSGKMEKTQLCTELETHLKHYTLILIQVS